MAKKTEAQLKELSTKMEGILRAGKVATTEQNAVDIENGYKAWQETLPKGVTPDLLEEVADHHRAFATTYSKVAGETCINHMKANNDVANMEHRLHTPLLDFGFSVARVDTKKGAKPTRQQVRASMATRVEFRLSDEIDEVENELASLFDLAD